MRKKRDTKKQEIGWYKPEAIQIAIDCCYDEKYILQLEQAKTNIEISQILASARKAKFG